jgi:hypothetical protein
MQLSQKSKRWRTYTKQGMQHLSPASDGPYCLPISDNVSTKLRRRRGTTLLVSAIYHLWAGTSDLVKQTTHVGSRCCNLALDLREDAIYLGTLYLTSVAMAVHVTPLVLSCFHAPRLCFLLTLYVRPDRFYRLPDSLRTLPLSRYLAALVSTRLIMLTFLFRLAFPRSCGPSLLTPL